MGVTQNLESATQKPVRTYDERLCSKNLTERNSLPRQGSEFAGLRLLEGVERANGELGDVHCYKGKASHGHLAIKPVEKIRFTLPQLLRCLH